MDRHSRRIPRAANPGGGGGGLPLGSELYSSTSGLSTAGLSRPRLFKVRQRPTARPGETEARVVGEKLGSWFPFDDSSRVPAGESVRSENGERSKPEWKGSEEGCKSFVFGSSRSFPESRSSVVGGDRGDWGVAGSGVFVFGSSADTRRTSHLYRDSRGSRSGIGFEKAQGVDSSIFGFGEGLGSMLPDRMSRLDIGKTGRDRRRVGVGDDKPKVDRSSTFSFGDNSTVFGQSMTSNLPEKMRSLNIDSSTCGLGFGEAKEDHACKPEVAREHVHHFGLNGQVKNSNMKSSSNVFEYEKAQGADGNSFGSSKDTTYSFDEDIASKLPEKIKRLNIENEQKNNQEDGKRDFKAGNLFSETSSKKTHVPAQNVTHDINNSTSTVLPDTLLMLNTEVSASESSIFGKTDSFVFSSSKNRSGSDNRNEIHKHIGETLLSSGIDNRSVKGLDSSFNCNGSTTDNSTLGESKFRASEQGTSTETGRGCSTNPDYHFVLNETGSSHQSSVDPGFTSAANDFTFTSQGVGASHMECKTPNKDTSFSSLENIFSEINRNLAFNSKKGASKDFRLRKRREKLKKVSQDYQNMPTSFVHGDNSPKENSEVGSAGCSSPMDFSPYEEILVANMHSRPSVSLDDSVPLDSCQTSRSMQQSFSFDDVGDLVSAAQHLGISETDIKGKEPNMDTVKDDVECFLDAKTSFVEEEDDGEEEVCKPGQMDSGSTTENNSIYYSSNNDSIETKFSSSSSTANDGIPGFSFCSGSNDVNQSSFTFAAAFTTQASFSSSKSLHKRKSQKKMGQKSHNSTLNPKFNVESTFLNSSTLPNIPVQTSPTEKHGSEEAPFIFEKNTGETKVKPNKRPEFKQEPGPSTPESVAVQEACEKWRLRGNQAYAKGNLSKAEEYYTRGVNCVSSNEHSGDGIHAIMLCYSNRAATRMSLGRMREALNDSMMAVAIDPNFLKAQVRTANCYLALGETENASELYKKCFEISNGDGSGSKILAEASDGLRNAQLVADYISHSAELLQKKTCDDVINALQMISEALLISPQSEGLIEMKAEALLLLKRYEEVIEFCEKTVESSQRNSSLFCADGPLKVEEAESKRFLPCKVWRWRLISRSHFHLGRLEEALGLLQKHELVRPISEKYGNKSLEFFASFSITIQELLLLKSAGNDAFQAGRHLAAVEHYTAALTCSIESHPFAAICFCNRAAAYQGLGQITDAIADCNLAIALDANYPKAISRRATLYELIRDYDQATCDLGRLVSLMEKRSKDKSNQSAAVEGSTKDRDALKQARLRLASIEEEARKGISLNMYTILGIESSSSAADIKKAYHRAALKHHPDKAGQLLVKGENSDDSVWKDVFNKVHMDADRLFKMIGEAYGVLSDPTKRMQYDADEEMRTILKKGSGMKQRDPEDFQYGHFDRRYSESPWRSHGSSHQRWSEYSYYSRH